MSQPSPADYDHLKRRLTGLNAAQRDLLLRRLGGGNSAAEPSREVRAAIPRARPARREEALGLAVYPASAGQKQMWFLQHYAPESPVYNVASAFRLVGPLNLTWLEAAFQAVIQRHDILRTTFALEDGELVQRVAASSGFRIQQFDLGSVAVEGRQAAAERCLAEESGRPFGLAAGPPLRGALVRLQPTDHLLLVVMHHIISDGWSRANFYRDLAAAYAALAAGRPAATPELPLQFADYSAWQTDRLAGDSWAAQADYWKTKLGGDAAPLELPADRPRPATQSFRGGRCSLGLEPRLLAALAARAREEGATLFMILLAAFKALLHRYTGSRDLCVGVPLANRPRPELEPLIGYFTNPVVVRTTLSPELTLREWLRRIKQTAVEAYANQEFPFARLVELLPFRRDASRPPLFQVSFALQDFPAVEFKLPGVQSAPWLVTTRTSKFDLSVALERDAQDWTAVAEYSEDLFDADRIQRMLGHWRVILESAAANPDQSVAALPLLTPAERHQLLVEWNRTERDYPRDRCVPELFEEQVARTPEAVALAFGEQTVTYRELAARANRLAHYLRRLKAGGDLRVAVCLPRSVDLIVGLLAVLKAGGAYVPLDPQNPKERLAFMLKDSGCAILVTASRLLPGLPSHHARVVCVDSDAGAIEQESQHAPAFSASAEGLAYVMYTSGSTGVPKGVAVPHRAINRLVLNTNFIRLDATDRVALVSNVSFDAATFEIWGALLNGARLVGFESRVVLSPPDFARALRESGVTAMFLTTALFNQIAAEAPGAFASLRTLIVGGEAMDARSARAVLADRPPARLLNAYGPTENTTFTSWHEIPSLDAAATRVPIGRPIANTRVYILDANLNPVPIGVPGELFVAGDGLAQGYWNRPPLTASRFLPDPFQSDPAARMYRTGDLCRWLADGAIEWLGRLDHQVKLRGHRIELGEIEAVLARHPAVREVAVVLREDAPGERHLAAYVTAQDGVKPTAGELREHLKAHLPDYMVPAAFVRCEQLPLTANGKVDRRALPAPDAADVATTLATDNQHARTLLEEKLRSLWQRLFNRPAVGVHDNFFELGGHSLLATRLCQEIEKLVGRRIPVAAVFQAPTVAELARMLGDQDWAPRWSSLVALQPRGNRPPLFVLHGTDGTVFGWWEELARLVDPDQPVFGLQAVGLDGKQPRHRRVEEMAAHYAREVQSFQPRGPYFLAGFSAGGLIAYELARQLVARGGEIGQVFLIESTPFVLPRELLLPVKLPAWLRAQGRRAARFALHETTRRRYLREVTQRIKRLAAAPSTRNQPLEPASPTLCPDAPDLTYYTRICKAYKPECSSVPVMLIQSSRTGSELPAIWRYLANGRLAAERLPGSHMELVAGGQFERVVSLIASRLQSGA